MPKVRTSTADPIRVDFVPPEHLPHPGRLGMTFAPGKKDHLASWDRDLRRDLQRLRDEFRADVLVSLIEDHERESLSIEALDGVAKEVGLRVHKFPIRDVSIPQHAIDLVPTVRLVLASLDAGETVVVHCRGGLGRTGLVVACCLIADGLDAALAVKAVRGAREGTIQTPAQERFVIAFPEVWRRARPDNPSLSRISGCLLGGALGDALGYPVEFLRTATDIERVLGAAAPEGLPHAKGRKAIVSDDTQMTLFTAEGLLRACQRSSDHGIGSSEAMLLHAYQRWLDTQEKVVPEFLARSAHGWLVDVPELHARRAPGNTCLSALRASLRWSSLPSVDAPPNDSKGCGAIMRSAPIGLAASSAIETFRTARDAAVLTHGHPSGFLSAAYFAAVVHLVSRGDTLSGALEVADSLLAKEANADEVVRAVEGAREAIKQGPPSRDRIGALGEGWVGEEALSIALYCALAAERSPASVARLLWVSVAHAGDSDSTGSLTGNLLGAMFGRELLPQAWLADLEMREVIERVSTDLYTVFVLGVAPDPRRYPAN
jgi:ADP-ribosylglycohydrolase/protein-tyrosine phosphatase